jgi:hypothetical protein
MHGGGVAPGFEVEMRLRGGRSIQDESFDIPAGLPYSIERLEGESLITWVLNFERTKVHPHRVPTCSLDYSLHGLAGDLARDDLGELSLIATDLLTYLPRAIRTAERD